MANNEKDSLFIVIPAYNEEENIQKIALEWHDVVNKTGSGNRLVIFNDGSTDSTLRKLQELKGNLPQLDIIDKVNSGHGGTVLSAYQYALEYNAQYVFQTDSDGQTLPEEFGNFWKNRADFDLLIGHRVHRQDGFSRIIVTKVLKLFIYIFWGVRTLDANCPFRLMNTKTLRTLVHKIPDGYNLTNVLLTALYESKNYKVRYIPITFRPRQGGINSINIKRIFHIGCKAIRDFFDLRKIFTNN